MLAQGLVALVVLLAWSMIDGHVRRWTLARELEERTRQREEERERDREHQRWVADLVLETRRRVQAEAEKHNAHVLEQMREAGLIDEDEPWKS